MWATAQILSRYHAHIAPPIKHSLDANTKESSSLRPLQLAHYLSASGVDPTWEHFLSSSFLLRNNRGNATSTVGTKSAWQVPHKEPALKEMRKVDPRDLGAVRASAPYFTLPAFCSLPAPDNHTYHRLQSDIRLWIEGELLSRCQPERMWLPCNRKRSYAPFLPCPQQLRDAIAFDYAVAQGWCDFNHPAAIIEPLSSIVEPEARFISGTSKRRADGPRYV